MLFDNKPMDVSLTQKKMQLWRHLSSYTESQIASGLDDLRKQAVAIEENLKNDPDFVKERKQEKSRQRRNLFQ
jgi:cytochrome c oxidase cbb3-type subunit I/II